MSLLAKIKSRGYWEFVIRPTKFVDRKVESVFDLREIVRIHRVGMRGWDFPNGGRSDVKIGINYIEQDVDFMRHVEVWRMYQSGQLVYFIGLSDDWGDQDRSIGSRVQVARSPKSTLGVFATVLLLTKLFEFAARLSTTAAGWDRMYVSAKVHGLAQRHLHMENASRDLPPLPPFAGLAPFALSEDFARGRLVSEPKDLALLWAREVFCQFGWNALLEILREIQCEAVRGA